MGIILVNGKQHNVIKRDGRIEPFSWEKLDRVLLWAIIYKTGINEEMSQFFLNEIKENLNLRIYDKIKIEKLFDELIDVTSNLASRMYPEFDKIARNLYIQKIYKETWGIKRNEYPDYREVVKKGLQYGIYNEEIWNSFTEDEIIELGNIINQENDFLFGSILGITTWMSKYSKKYSKTKYLELPQHTIMRYLVNAFWREPKDKRLEFIKFQYQMLSEKQVFTKGTPNWLNSGTPKPMLASCVLTAMEDDSFSINQTCSNIGIYSKEGGGTACDVTKIRSIGAVVDKTGRSSGKIPFIKKIEAEIVAYNQKGTRPGACAVYFPWWDYEVEDLIMLKDEGGSEDKRARKLQYAIKLDGVFIERVLNDEEITLLDPGDVPELTDLWGEKFRKKYEELENKSGIRRKRVKARDIAYLIAKARNETGNLYVFFTDNANEQTPFEMVINSSNLCTEVMLPSRGPKRKDYKIEENWNDKKPIIKQEWEGLISLCNLSSVTITEWVKLNDDEKSKAMYLLLRGHDNEIEHGYYPVKEGEIGNKLWRPIGIGVSSLAAYFAFNKVKFTDPESFRLEFDVIEDIYWHAYNASNILAQERGFFPKYKETKWSKGWLPIDRFYNIFEFYAEPWQIERWEELRERIKKYGVRFAAHSAIAPTACQTKDGKIKTEEGIKSLEQIMSEQGIDYKTIEKENKIGWYEFKKPIKVETRFGLKESNKIYFNGFREVYEIEFEDGKKYKFTGNHMLWVNGAWKKIENIMPGDETTSQKIKSIKKLDELQSTWDIEVEEVHEYLLENGVVSHNTSSLYLRNGTEGIEPVKDLVSTKTGTYTCKQFVPEIRKYGLYYQTAWEIPNEVLLKHAQIRQIFLDQGQSVNTYTDNPQSAYETIESIIYAYQYGLKSLYYLNMKKGEVHEVCESCSS